MTAPADMTKNRDARKNWAVGWDELHRHSRTLARRLLELGPWRGIAAVTRGGLVPAAIVAGELDIRLVDTICVASYEAREQGAVRILKGLEGDGDGLLVIDDLVDSGRTARAVRALLPWAHYAVLYAKPAGKPLADSFVLEVAQDVWIDFPWDQAPRSASSLPEA